MIANTKKIACKKIEMIDSHTGGRNTCTLSHSMVLLGGVKVSGIKDQQTYFPATEQVQIHNFSLHQN